MNMTLNQLKQAISIKEEIVKLEAQLNKILGGGNDGPLPSVKPAPVKKGRKTMSASAKAKISAAAKARWAKIKGAAPAAKPAKKKSGLSPEGRARIVAALKKRWAAQKAAASKRK